MKKVLLSLLLLVTVIGYLGWRGLSNKGTGEPPVTSIAPRPPISKRAREHASISLPTAGSRRPNSQKSDIQNALAPWWVHYSEDEKALYDLKLIEQDPFQEVYQVSYRGFAIQHLHIRRELQSKQIIDPLPVFTALDDNDMISIEDSMQVIRNQLSESAGEMTFRGRVWSLGGNQTLIPSYLIEVLNRDSDDIETWTINSKTGDVLSRNTHSRR